jgi:thiazole/oxazole-forming peptide maturase SagC family component
MELNDLTKKLRFRKYFYTIPMDKERWQLRTGGQISMLSGRSVADLIPLILPLLDGNHTIKEIIFSLSDRVDQKVVLQVLDILNKKRFLEDASEERSFEIFDEGLKRYVQQILLFSHTCDDKYERQDDLKRARILIIGLGQIGTEVLCSLASSGIGKITGVDSGVIKEKDKNTNPFYTKEDIGKPKCETARTTIQKLNPYISLKGIKKEIKSAKDVKDLIPEGCNLVIVCMDRPAVSIYDWVNEACLEKSIPWMRGSLDEQIGVIGPLIIPYQTACYECYKLRRESNLALHTEEIAFENYLKRNPDNKVEYGTVIPFVKIVANFIALEVLKFLSQFDFPVTCGSILQINLYGLEYTISKILKLPRCPACGKCRRMPAEEIWNL